METVKKNQSEMKNNLQGINSKVDETENQNSDSKYKEAQNTQSG